MKRPKPRRILTKKAKEYFRARHYLRNKLEHFFNLEDYGGQQMLSRWREDKADEVYDQAHIYALQLLTNAILGQAKDLEEIKDMLETIIGVDIRGREGMTPADRVKETFDSLSKEDQEELLKRLKGDL